MEPEDTQQPPEEAVQEPVQPTEVVEQEQETVDVHDATHEEVKKALEDAVKQEELGEAQPETSEPVVDDTPKDSQPSGQQTVAKDPASATSPAPAAQPDASGKPADERRLNIEKHRELFVQQRTQQFNSAIENNRNARTLLESKRAELENGLDDLFNSNPRAAIERRDEITKIQARIEQIDVYNERAQGVYESQVFFAKHVDPETTVDDLAEVLKADGLPDQVISHFKTNPWEFTTPEALVQFGKRAMDRKELNLARKDNGILANYVLSLQKENEALKKRPGQVLKQVQKHLNAPSPITGATSTSQHAPVNIDPTKMSRAELQQAIKAGNIAQ